MAPSLGLMIGLPIGILLVIGFVVLFVVLRRVGRGMEDDPYGDKGVVKASSWISLGIAVVAALITSLAMYPYNMEYHSWTPVEGKVAKVSSRMLKDGEGMTERFVVTFEDGRKRACDDTRCSQIEVGDAINLTCKREWQFAGVDGWVCNWAGSDGTE